MSGRWALPCGMGLVFWSLACGGATPREVSPQPAPEPVPERPVPAAPEPASPVSALEPWQEPFAARPKKDVHDYYMLLPKDLFECEMPNGPKTEAERDDRLTERMVADGYLAAKGDGFGLAIAMFRGPEHDTVAVVINDGLGSMCNEEWFAVWDDAARGWTEVEVLPRKKIDARVPAGTTAWWLSLPKKGTDTPVVDENGKVLLTLQWKGGRFALPAGK